MQSSQIRAFIICRRCHAEDKPLTDLMIGMTTTTTLRVWCPRHGLLADYELTTPQPLQCDECGEVHASGHVH